MPLELQPPEYTPRPQTKKTASFPERIPNIAPDEGLSFDSSNLDRWDIGGVIVLKILFQWLEDQIEDPTTVIIPRNGHW